MRARAFYISAFDLISINIKHLIMFCLQNTSLYQLLSPLSLSLSKEVIVNLVVFDIMTIIYSSRYVYETGKGKRYYSNENKHYPTERWYSN